MRRHDHPCPQPDYTWWAACSEEGPYCDTCCTSKNDAIEEAIGMGRYQELEPVAEGQPWRAGFYLAWARPRYVDLSRYFDVDDWLSRIEDDMTDEDGPDEYGDHHPLSEISDAAARDLEASVRTAIWHWQNRKALPLKTYWLDMPYSEEWVVRDLPDADA